MPSTRENMDRLVQATVNGFNTWDYDGLRATRSDDFIYQFLPSTLNAPPRNNDDYAEFWKTQLTPLFSKFIATPTTIIHDVDARRSVVMAFATVDADDVGPAEIEIVIVLSFNDDCSRISRIDEFFDSLAYTNFFAKVTEMQAQGADKSSGRMR